MSFGNTKDRSPVTIVTQQKTRNLYAIWHHRFRFHFVAFVQQQTATILHFVYYKVTWTEFSVSLSPSLSFYTHSVVAQTLKTHIFLDCVLET